MCCVSIQSILYLYYIIFHNVLQPSNPNLLYHHYFHIAFEPDDVSLPAIQLFEVRVVIWKSKNVPAMDSLEGMSDLYVKCWPEGSPAQDTDVHWRCKKGKASWNYRLNFDVELGHSTKAMKFPYLHFQLWDRYVLGLVIVVCNISGNKSSSRVVDSIVTI